MEHESPDSVAAVEDVSYDSDATQNYEAAHVEDILWEQDLDEENEQESDPIASDTSTSPPPKKKNRGGPRNHASYETKMHCVDISIVRNFLATGKCGCGKNCIQKLHSHGALGEQVTNRLRQARFAGMRPHRPTPNVRHVCSKL